MCLFIMSCVFSILSICLLCVKALWIALLLNDAIQMNLTCFVFHLCSKFLLHHSICTPESLKRHTKSWSVKKLFNVMLRFSGRTMPLKSIFNVKKNNICSPDSLRTNIIPSWPHLQMKPTVAAISQTCRDVCYYPVIILNVRVWTDFLKNSNWELETHKYTSCSSGFAGGQKASKSLNPVIKPSNWQQWSSLLISKWGKPADWRLSGEVIRSSAANWPDWKLINERNQSRTNPVVKNLSYCKTVCAK